MTGLFINAVTYLAVCSFVTVIWALTAGSFESVQLIARNVLKDPALVRELGFWPVWIWLAWGVALVIHASVVVANGLFGRRRRRRRRARHDARVAQRALRGVPAVAQVPVGVPGPGVDEHGRERRWVTVMFTDIAGSTRMNEMLGDEEWSRLLGEHRMVVRQALADRGGTEVGTQGDGFLARFGTPADAVLCGVDIQRAMGSLGPRSQEGRLRLRIGIHAGEAVDHEGDLVGRVVNVAARVAGEAEPGEILVTEPVADYLGVSLEVEDRGIHSLKGVSQPRHLLAVRWSDDVRQA